MVFVSIGLRFRVEAEAMNMVEPLGSYLRHRTVYVLKRVRRKRDDKVILSYRAIPVPAVSGQSVANAYSRALVDIAKLIWGENAPLCDECKNYHQRGGFTKRSGDRSISHDKRVEQCIVEDITGFLVAAEEGARAEGEEGKKGKRQQAEEIPRRTSAIWFSYMVPDIDYGAGAVESQFHVRYNFEAQEHQPFTIESGSAIYMQLIAIDVDRVGQSKNQTYVKDRKERIEAAFKALLALYEGHVYGAKKSRYLPLSEILGGVAAVSPSLPFMVSKPKLYYGGKTYIEDTVDRACRFINALAKSHDESATACQRSIQHKLYIVYFDREGVLETEKDIDKDKKDKDLKPTECKDKDLEVEGSTDFTDMINKVLNKVMDFISEKGSEKAELNRQHGG
jgi:CRISPR-associated protein Csa2